MVESSISASGGGGNLPRLQGLRSEGAKRVAVNEMALDVESVVDGGVNGQEALCRSAQLWGSGVPSARSCGLP